MNKIERQIARDKLVELVNKKLDEILIRLTNIEKEIGKTVTKKAK